jgi:hypothetical protein
VPRRPYAANAAIEGLKRLDVKSQKSRRRDASRRERPK